MSWFDFRRRQNIFLFSQQCQTALDHSHVLLTGSREFFLGDRLKKSGREANDTLPPSAEFRTGWCYLNLLHRINLCLAVRQLLAIDHLDNDFTEMTEIV